MTNDLLTKNGRGARRRFAPFLKGQIVWIFVVSAASADYPIILRNSKPILDSLVQVIVSGKEVAPGKSKIEPIERHGTGFLIANSGYIMTANHLFYQQQDTAMPKLIDLSVEVKPGGSERPNARLIRASLTKNVDIVHDLALLQIPPNTGLKTWPTCIPEPPPDAGRSLAVFGFRRGEREKRTKYAQDEGPMNGVSPEEPSKGWNTSLRAAHGQSGSPVLDARDYAVAVAVATEDDLTIVQPLTYAQNMLSTHLGKVRPCPPASGVDAVLRDADSLWTYFTSNASSIASEVYYALNCFDTCKEDIRKQQAKESMEGLLAKGLRELNAKNYNGAILAFQAALKIDGRSIIGRNGLGLAYYNRKDYARAIAEFSAALAVQPTYVPALNNRGISHYRLGKDYKDSGQIERAEAAFLSAIKDLSRALELQKDSGLYFNRGQAFADKPNPDYKSAFNDFDAALRLDPLDAAIRIARGAARTEIGDYPKAVQDLTEAVRFAPCIREDQKREFTDDERQNCVQALLNRGVAYERWGAIPLALADLSQAVDRYRLELARDQAANEKDEIDEDQKDLYDALNERCWARAIWGRDLSVALQDCNEAQRLLPNKADAYDSRGLVWLKLGKLDQAIQDFTDALARNDQLAESYYGRGLAKLRKGDRRGAESDFAKARSLSPKIDAEYARYYPGNP